MRTIHLNFFLIAVCVLIFGVLPGHARQNNETAIRNMLAAQVTQWNKGNIAGYMKGYWENDSLLFIGKNGPAYGFSATLQRYRKSYPDAGHMGQLTSTIVSMNELSPQYYFVVGKWHLQRKAGDLEGSYTLLIKKIKGQWVIVADHSS
jgi:ketosteroid isomerase-like protein